MKSVGASAIFLLALFTTVLRAGDVRDLSSILRPLQSEQKVPGLAAAVLRDGKLVAAGAVGVRKFGAEPPLTINDRFHVGSCTKAMTATLAAILVDAHAIEWDSTVDTVLGEQHEIDSGWNDVTLLQLLNHVGGAPADLPRAVFATRGQNTAHSRRMIVKQLLSEPPGERGKYVYSDAGYVIAGAMLEATGGMSWEKLIHQKLFQPLGITSAGFGAPGAPGAIDQPRGHSAAGRPLEPTPFADNPLAIGPAGTVHMTLADWLKFAALHIRGGRAEEHAQDRHDLLGISTDSFNRMRTAPADATPAYTCGWIIAPSRQAGINVLTHDGSNTLWYATIWVSPRMNMAVVVAANQGGDGAVHACHNAMDQIVRQQLDYPSRPDAGN